MRRARWLILAVLVGCVCAPAAAAREWSVVDSGRSPSGAAYAWIVWDWGDLYCTRLAWEWQPRPGNGGVCEGYEGERIVGDLLVPFRGIDARFVRRGPRDVVVSGFTDPRVARVRVVYTDRAGGRRDLPVDYARVVGDEIHALSARVGGPVRPFGVYTAFVPAAAAARDRLAARERKLRGADPSLPPVGAIDLSDLARGAMDCRGPSGPFELIAYDADGRRLDNLPAELCRHRARAARRSPSAGQAIRDCAGDGDLDRRYPPGVLREAVGEMPTDLAEYSDCVEVLERAQQETERQGSGDGAGSEGSGTGAGGGSGGAGSDPGGGSRGGDAGGSRDGDAGGMTRAVDALTDLTGRPWGWLAGGVLAALAGAAYAGRRRIGALARRLPSLRPARDSGG